MSRAAFGSLGHMTERPTLYVCHGDTEGPRFHPCRRVQEAMKEKDIEYDKVIGGHRDPIVFPFSPAVVSAVAPRLQGFSLSKGTVRFGPDQPLPEDVLVEMVRLRAAEI